MKKNFDNHHGAKGRSFNTNEPVYVRMQRHNKQYWTQGLVKRRNNVMYDVEVNNQTMARHANQLEKRYNQSSHREESTHDGLLTVL